MKAAFFKTDTMRQRRLLEAATAEFSAHTFEEASINRIIQTADISKGGLFKYIDKKETLYLYVIECALKQFVDYQFTHASLNTHCYIDRVWALAESSIGFRRSAPEVYQLILKVSFDFGTPCAPEIHALRKTVLGSYEKTLVEGVDWSQYTASKEAVIAHVSLILNGFNAMALQMMARQDALEACVQTVLKPHLTLVKTGLLKDGVL